MVHIRLHEEEVVDDILRDLLCFLRAFSARRHLDKVCPFGILDIEMALSEGLCVGLFLCTKVNRVNDRVEHGARLHQLNIIHRWRGDTPTSHTKSSHSSGSTRDIHLRCRTCLNEGRRLILLGQEKGDHEGNQRTDAHDAEDHRLVVAHDLKQS